MENRLQNGIPGAAAYGNINHNRSSWTSVIDLTHSFNSRIVGDVRASFNRYVDLSPDGSLAAGTSSLTPAALNLTMPTTTSSRSLAPEIDFNNDSLPGLSSNTNQYPRLIGNYVNPNYFETYDLNPSITQTLGRHTLHYGGQFSLYHDVQSGVGLANGGFHFGTSYTQKDPLQRNNDGSAIADLLLGYPDGGQVDHNIQPYESYKYYGFYVQDDWKVNSKLAINAGIRWDEERSPVERHNRLLAGVCLTCNDPISSKLNYPTGNILPNGFVMPNPLNGTITFAGPNNPAYPNNNGSWQPKIGVSYSPASWIVMHGGFTLGKALGAELGGTSAWNYTTQYQASLDGGVTPTSYFADGSPFPNGAVVPPGASLGPSGLDGDRVGTDQPDRKIPHTRQYTFGIQSQMPENMIFSIAYLGAYTTGLRASKQLNGLSRTDFFKGAANPSYLNQLVANPFYGALSPATSMGASPTIQARYLMVPYPQYHADLFDYTYPAGYSNYSSMITSLEKRFSGSNPLLNKLSLLVSFTWSKAMSATNLLNNSGAGLVDDNPRYQLDGSDRPWDLAISGLYGVPIGRGGVLLANAGKLTQQVVSGWQLEWIFKNDGGTPVNYPNHDYFSCGTYRIVPANRTVGSYLNNSTPSCFRNFGQFDVVTDSSTTSSIRNPWAQQTQIGIEKRFPIRERLDLQFKAEAFNITNTPIYYGPDTGNPEAAPVRNLNQPNQNLPGAYTGYGTIGPNQANQPRQIQLSLKAQF